MPTVTNADEVYVTSNGSAYNIVSGRTLIKKGNTLYEISGNGSSTPQGMSELDLFDWGMILG